MLFYYMFFMFLFSICLFLLSLYFKILDLVVMLEYEILHYNSMNFVMVMLFDWMSLLFMSFVLMISSMVILYSYEYMSNDLNMNRFILLIIMFVISMMLLIISPNLMSILLGWDGLGLVSYCLVIYYQNVKSYIAGMLTVLSNRLGDVFLLISICWMVNFGSFNWFNMLLMSNSWIIDILCFLIVLAAFTKSAQIPFSAWLPAAMAAPTPVSSLVHSSTLVTAGVYLLIRFNFFFSEKVIFMGLFLSSLTMFMSGLIANFFFDLKKIIALSTLSQLGLMMTILFLGEYCLSYFHLLTHALFKALLFMCAGNIIHNLLNFQDIRFMGGLINYMPLTCTLFSISNFSLCGLPFLSGFYSKDLILEFSSMNYLSIYMYIIFYLSTGFTVSYSIRLMYYFMIGDFNLLSLFNFYEKNSFMLMSMMVLGFLVIFMGSMLNWLIFLTPVFIYLSLLMKLMTIFVIISGMMLGLELSNMIMGMKSFKLKYINFMNFSSLMWGMPYLFSFYFSKYVLNISLKNLNILDNGWFEFYSIYNLKLVTNKNSFLLNKIYLLNIKFYLLVYIFILFLII